MLFIVTVPVEPVDLRVVAPVTPTASTVMAADAVKLIVSTFKIVGAYVPAVLNTMFIVSVPAPPSIVSKPCKVCVEFAFKPALIVSAAAVPLIVSIPAVNA